MTTDAYAHSIQVYPKPFVPGWWNYHVAFPGGMQLGSASSEAEAWRVAREILSERKRRAR